MVTKSVIIDWLDFHPFDLQTNEWWSYRFNCSYLIAHFYSNYQPKSYIQHDKGLIMPPPPHQKIPLTYNVQLVYFKMIWNTLLYFHEASILMWLKYDNVYYQFHTVSCHLMSVKFVLIMRNFCSDKPSMYFQWIYGIWTSKISQSSKCKFYPFWLSCSGVILPPDFVILANVELIYCV